MNTPPHPGLAGGPVYVDYNATTPVDPRVAEAASPHWTRFFGNPSSSHAYGSEPRSALATARGQVAELLGAKPAEIVFTASGSEADLLALRGAVLGAGGRDAHLIVEATEHPAILATGQALARLHGTRVTVLPVDDRGLVDPGALETALRGSEGRAVVSIMLANNETGTIQPVAELARIAHRHHALVHTDAAQACGKIPVDVEELGVDLLTLVGHKMYAPRGAAALYVRSGVSLEPVVYGGGQERGLRAGTENVALAVALGVAAQLAADDFAADEPKRIAALRDDLHQRLHDALPGRVRLHGHPERRLPNTLNIGVEGSYGYEILDAAPEIAASTGSACHSGVHSPSPVLTAMGLDSDRALGALRLSLGRWSTVEEVETIAEALVRAVGTGGRRGAKTGNSTSAQSSAKPEPGGKPERSPGTKSSAQPEPNAQLKSSAKAEPSAKSGTRPKSSAQPTPSAKSEAGAKPGNARGTKAQRESQAKSGAKSGAKSTKKSGTEPGAESGGEPGTKS